MNRVEVISKQLDNASPSLVPVVVLGACFLDYIGYVKNMPKPGETKHSDQFQKGFGGKGANQAVMAGRLGSKVRMVSVVGSDGDGTSYVNELKKNGVACDTVYQIPNASSGLALIFVDTLSGQNEIVICPNATTSLTVEYLKKASNNYNDFLNGCRFLICQNEIPLSTTLEVIREAHGRGIYTVFNSAPAPSPSEVEAIKPYLKFMSLFCPNETEASAITGVNVQDAASAFEAIKKLQQMGVADVVITLGSNGFAIATRGAEPSHHPCVRVKAVDTTGAGDCFVGSMVYFLEKGKSLLESCKRANVCAALSVQRKGTQSSYPHPSELPQSLFE